MKKHLLAVALFAASCGHVDIDPPKGFVESKQSKTILRLVSADASVMRVSYRKNKKNGTTSFWSTLMVRELVDFKGYKLLKKTSYKGEDGTILELRAPYLHKEFSYTVGILAGEDDLYIVELGCRSKVYAKHRPRFLTLLGRVHDKLD